MFTFSKLIRSINSRSNQITVLGTARNVQKCRSFHKNSRLHVKMFYENENRYAYSIMQDKKYSINLDVQKCTNVLSKEQFDKLITEDWTKKPPVLMFEALSTLGVYACENNLCISDKIFDAYIDNLTDNLKAASDKELESLFYALAIWPETVSIRTRNFIEVWAALDDECVNRLKNWSFDQMLVFESLFFMLNVTRVSDFSKKCLNKLASKAKQLSPGQLVQTIFFIGVWRQQPFDIHNLELQLDNCFNEFSVDDLAIMSMGFFKSKTPIRSMELVSKFADKIIENSRDIHEISLAALVKIIRYSMKYPQDDTIYRLLDVLQHEVPRLSVMCNVHVALLGTSTLMLHKDCLTKIADTVMKCMSKARLKDLERLVLTYGTFNFAPPTPKCFFQKVMDELRNPERNDEIQKYGRSFNCCIGYLGLMGFYPVDLINKGLCPKYLETSYGKQSFTYGREVLIINNTADIFCPEAKINRLTDKVAKILAKKYTDFVPDEHFSKQYNVTEKMFLDVYKMLKRSRGGSDFVIGDHILTHHQRGGKSFIKSKVIYFRFSGHAPIKFFY